MAKWALYNIGIRKLAYIFLRLLLLRLRYRVWELFQRVDGYLLRRFNNVSKPLASDSQFRDGRLPTGWKRSVYRGSSQQRSSGGGQWSWRCVDPSLLHEACCAVTDAGNGILLTRSPDGGVGGVVICVGRERYRAWVRTREEAHAVLTMLITGDGQPPGDYDY